MAWDRETDVISIGSGIGGLAGAITAAQAGLQAIVLEKTAQVGGVTAYSFGDVWAGNNHLAAKAGIQDSAAETQTYMEFLGAGFADAALQAVFIDKSPEALQFFERTINLRLVVVDNFSDYYFPHAPGSKQTGRFLEIEPFDARVLGDWAAKTRVTPHYPYALTHEDMFASGGVASIQNWDFALMATRLEKDIRCLGPGLAAAFVAGALKHGVELHVNSPATSLVYEEGRVAGVIASTPSGRLRIKARRGVLVASSAYDWNLEFRRYYESSPEFHTGTPPGIDGDHIKMAGALGAKIASVPAFGTITFLAYQVPGEEHDGQPLYRFIFTESGLPHSIIINQHGQRFGDEAFYRTLTTAVHEFDGTTQKHKHWPIWMVFDQNHRDKYPIGSIMPGAPMPADLSAEADTVAELAAKIGVDETQLQLTIARFNEFAKQGNDEDYGRGRYPWSNYVCGDLKMKPNPNLGPLEKPPFYAMRLTTASAGHPAAGLRINEDAQVMGFNDAPIPGLYAAGNSTAYLDLGSGMQSGMANMRGMLQGYLAGRHMTGESSEQWK